MKNDPLAWCVIAPYRVCIFPDALTHRVTKVPKGCSVGFWHFWHLVTLGFARRHRARQLEERMKASSWEDSGLVFPNTKGKIRRRDSAVRSFKRYLEEAGIPSDVRFHDHLHTAGTLALRQGMPLHAVSKMLGHSDPAMTLRRCAHVLEDMEDEGGRAMDELF